MSQTTVQQLAAIRKGSVRVLVGDDFSSLVDIGALRNPVFTSLVENQSIVFDNVDELKKFVNGKKVQVSFDLAEINFSNLAVLDSGFVNVETIAGSLVEDAVQTVNIGWAYNKFIEIENQNGNGETILIDSVTGATDGLLVEGTDYYKSQNEKGKWGIFIIDSATLTTLNQNISIVYDYTPNASKKVTFSESGNKILKAMRLINTDESNKTFKIDIEEGTNFSPISIDFAGDDEEDVAILPVEFHGNIVDIVDEQQTT